MEENNEKELPKLPEKQTLTFQGDNINQLYDQYMKGNAVEFPPWVKIENNKVRISPQELFKFFL